jgi:hypothetical protein
LQKCKRYKKILKLFYVIKNNKTMKRHLLIIFLITGSLNCFGQIPSTMPLWSGGTGMTAGLPLQNGEDLSGGSSTQKIWRLTNTGADNQRGAIWTRDEWSSGAEFDVYFNAYFGCDFGLPIAEAGVEGGDGMAFVMHNMTATTMGGTAGNLGYGGMSKAIAVEFDTWFGASPDVNSDHIQMCRDNPTSIFPAGSTNTVSVANLEDNLLRTIRIRYIPGSVIRVWVYPVGTAAPAGGAFTWSESIDLRPEFAAGGGGAGASANTFRWGWSAATGSARNQHYVSYNATVTPPVFTPTQTLRCPVLPVVISYVNVSEGDGGVNIDWQTTSEKNSLKFEIQKSVDGIEDWVNAGEVKAMGNSIATTNYSFTDPNPYFPKSYYRLRQTDLDGKYYYSNAHFIEIKEEKTFSVYPNPASDELNIYSNSFIDEEHTITFINKNGEVVYSTTSDGTSLQKIDLAGITSGMYQVKIANENYVKYHKVSIIH